MKFPKEITTAKQKNSRKREVITNTFERNYEMKSKHRDTKTDKRKSEKGN